MSRFSSFLLVLFVLLTLTTLSVAQEVTPAEAEALKAGDQQAFELLEIIAEGIPSLRVLENRTYLTNVVADLLWSTDEKRARALFEAVTREMASAVAAFDPTDQEKANELWMIQQQRQEIIDRMARHDPGMAMAFLRATRLPREWQLAQHGTSEIHLELHLAALIAGRDPAQALRIARASLRTGMPGAIVPVLNQLDAIDRNSARSLHGEIVDQLKNEDFSRNHEVANTAWSLLSSYQPPQAKDETYRELIDLLASSVLAVTPRDAASISYAQNYYSYLRSAMPQIEKYAPGRAASLQQWLQSVQRTQDPGTRMHQELNDLTQKGTIDDILALAGKYAPEYRTQIYEQAVWKATSSGDPNRARQIVSELVTDQTRRGQILDQLDNQMAWNAVQENKIAEARRMLSQVKSVEQRVNLLITMATNVASKGDKKQALNLFAEALTSLDSSPPDANKLALRMQLAQNYSALDSERGAALLESIVTQVNQFVAAAAVLDGIERRYLKDGEWQKGNYSSLGNLLNTLAQNLGQLARHDPASARYLSNHLERTEIRLMTQLEIAQSLLAGRSSSDGTQIRRVGRFSR